MNKKEKFVKKYVKKGKSADYGLKRYRKYNDYLKHKSNYVDKLKYDKKIIITFTLQVIKTDIIIYGDKGSGKTLILHFTPKTNHINTTLQEGIFNI